MKKLPIGIQSFEEIRNKDYLYVDKTEIIHNLITSSGKAFFLSRPRRFGKSLLISTMEALFQGKKSLFEGLHIYDNWDWTQQNPVIRLDFAGINHDTSENLLKDTEQIILNIARQYGITLTRDAAGSFLELIGKMHETTGRQVVVLVDEYDKPIIEHLTDLDMAEENRKVLKSFFQILKSADEHLRLVFLTGVSKFTNVSIFSELNNLNDITMDSECATICGYTQAELETCFDEYIEQLAGKNKLPKANILEGIRHWYNGYSWDGETAVYNPFSTLLLFKKQSFSNYWFETGTPSFLIDLIKKRNDIKPMLEPVTIGDTAFMGFDIHQISIVPILFQTGYLTVKKKQFIPMKPAKYTLAIPNEEVSDSFLAFLVSSYAGYPVEQTPIIREQMQEQINNCDAEGFAQSLRILLANIPYTLHIKHESYYHSLLLAWMKMLGFDIQGEVMTDIGRIDAVWHQPGLTVVAEIKYSVKKKAATLLNEATAQIRDRKYYEKFLDANRLVLMAVAFSEKEINCRIENIKQ